MIALLRATRFRQLSYKAGKRTLGDVDWQSIAKDYLRWYNGFVPSKRAREASQELLESQVEM